MKNFFYGLIATVLLLATPTNAKNLPGVYTSAIGSEDVFTKKHIEGDIKLSGGCVIHYSIDIDYQLFPPRINSIHGSITMTGPCSGTQTFKAVATTDEKGTITALETDLTDKNLQTKEFNEALMKSLNEQNIFEQK
ncbi:hypothetical protein [Flavobacterium sp. XGLA_31]|uniref:hypothetical protein n=1 Tax=Flavobacterium sp. XGLA_31 TaxID=3447666 RepID=UPI003F31D16D